MDTNIVFWSGFFEMLRNYMDSKLIKNMYRPNKDYYKNIPEKSK